MFCVIALQPAVLIMLVKRHLYSFKRDLVLLKIFLQYRFIPLIYG